MSKSRPMPSLPPFRPPRPPPLPRRLDIDRCITFVVAAQESTHCQILTVQVRWVACKGGLAGAPSFHVNRPLRATNGFILIRYKRYSIYICLHLSSSNSVFRLETSAFWIWKLGGAWHKAKIWLVKKYTPISWFLAILSLSTRSNQRLWECLCKCFLVRFR